MAKKVDISKFPDWGGPGGLPKELKNVFFKLGMADMVRSDDVIGAQPRSWPANRLDPTQMDVYLSKSLGMAMGTPDKKGIAGGNLKCIVSSDGYILDGHHRWAATLFSKPTASLHGIRVDLPIDQLVPVLRTAGDAFGNKRRGAPPNDLNIFSSSIDDVMEIIETGKGINIDGNKFSPKEWETSGMKSHAINWMEKLGGKSTLRTRLAEIKRHKTPPNSPPRSSMPVIDPDVNEFLQKISEAKGSKGQEIIISRLLRKGAIDLFPPYGML